MRRRARERVDRYGKTGELFILDTDAEACGCDFTVAWLVKFCDDNGIDPKTATVAGAYGEPTELRWPEETDE